MLSEVWQLADQTQTIEYFNKGMLADTSSEGDLYQVAMRYVPLDSLLVIAKIWFV